MKKIRIIISIMLVLSLLCVCTAQAFAVEENDVMPEEKISNELKEKMAEAEDDELIPAWIWYEDVNQSEIDSLTEEAVGYKEDESTQEIMMPDSDLLELIKNDGENASKEMEEYLRISEKERSLEYFLTNKYIMKRREISREKYNTKADSIINDFSLSSESIIFQSQYAPMLIVMMTKSQIETAADDKRLDLIGYYIEPPKEYCTVQSVQTTTGQEKVESDLGLTGDGVKVGMVDLGYPNAGSEIDLDNIIKIGNPSSASHATNTATTMVGSQSGFAKDITLYSTDSSFNNIELMISAGITLMNVSFGWIYFEDNTSSDYAYSFYDKWFDHLVAQHNLTVVASAGNDGQGPYYQYPDGTFSTSPVRRVLSPAMGHNVIAVGAFNDNGTGLNKSDDYLENTSSYKNSNGTTLTTGVEKPDVVLPSNLLGGGTSTSAPVLTSLIAQIFQLKPSLASYPHAVKAIVLASCHYKALPSADGETEETMDAGITERQGAGVPNAWIMAAIVSQGTYGVGTINTQNKIVEFEQPFYDAGKLNVSLTWLNNNTCSEYHHTDFSYTYLSVGQDRDLDLNLYRNGVLADSSDMLCSSTELCYINNISNTNDKYKVEIVSDGMNLNNKFGYAWSTNNMRASSTAFDNENRAYEGIYCVKTIDNQYVLNYNTSANYDYLKANLVLNNNQNSFSDTTKWILVPSNGSPEKLSIKVGYGNNTEYMGISSTNVGSYWRPIISNIESSYWTPMLEDGTYSFINGNFTKILSYQPFGLYWVNHSYGNTIQENEKWNFCKSNYIKGDANADGQITLNDVQYIQQSLASIITLNNIEKYLSDLNHDGSINILDATKANQMLNNNLLY